MKKRSMASLVAVALWIAFTTAPTLGQQMTPEEQAIYDQMVRNVGRNPKQVTAASTQAQLAHEFGDVVRYSVVGVYQGRTNVSAEPNWIAYADVGDRIEMQFDWKVSEAKLMSAASLQNHKSTLANPRNWEAKCAPPKIIGPFEYELKSIEQGIGGTLRLHVQTSFPPVQVHQMCTGAVKSIAAKQTMGAHEFMVPPPTMLLMSLPPGSPVTLSADRKSLVHQKDGWTWTFTPRNK